MRYLNMLVLMSMVCVTANAGEFEGDCSNGMCSLASNKARPVINVVKAPVNAVINVAKVPVGAAINVVRVPVAAAVAVAKAPVVVVDRLIDRPREHQNSNAGCECVGCGCAAVSTQNASCDRPAVSHRYRRSNVILRRCK